MRHFLSPKTLMISLGLVAGALPASAETDYLTQANTNAIIQDTGVANRLVAGEILRSLSQEIPASACHLQNGVGTDEAAFLLSSGIEELDQVMDAILQGDPYWGIFEPEERRKTIAEIDALRADWVPLQAAVTDLLATSDNAAAADLLAGSAPMMLDHTYRLLTTLDAQYSGSAEIQQRDVMYIQMSGRLAALNQQIALNACLLWSEGMNDAVAAELDQSMQLYHNIHAALTNGLESMGILPPQTPGISEKLEEIGAVWADTRPQLDRIVAGESLTQSEREALYSSVIDERYGIIDLLYLYMDHSKFVY